MTPASALPPGLTPRREAVALVVDVWARRRSGEYRGAGGCASVVMGEPQDNAGLSWLVAAMCRSGLRFRDQDAPASQGLGRVPLGPTLLDAGRRLGSPAAVRATLDDPLVAGPYASALARLPLRPATRRLVRSALGERGSLGAALDALSLAPEAVEQDLSALVALGVLRSRGVAPPRMRSAGVGGSSSRPDLQRRRQLSRRRLKGRLEREWQTLSGADDWVVLGVAPGTDPALMQRGAARMRARYAALAVDVDDLETRRLVRSLQTRVEQAIDRLRVPETASNTGDELVPGPEQALRLGQEAAARGDLSQARRWLGLAQRQDPDEPMALAWYGWAMVVDPRTSGGTAVDRGRRLVRQALKLAPRNPVVLERAVEVAVHLGEVAEAHESLQQLVEAEPRHPALSSLRHRVSRL